MSPTMRIKYIKLDRLRPSPRNARTHSTAQIRKIADSIERFGFTNPVLIDGEDRIVAGHGRLEAAKLRGITEVPTIRLDHMSLEEVRAYALADNKLAELAGWDREILAIELQALSELEVEFDLEITGFETAEIDMLFQEAGEEPDEADTMPPEPDPASPAVSRPGDLWQLGAHRLLCGDALDAADLDRLMAGERARVTITDPPYNVKIAGFVSGKGAARHKGFAMAAGEMTEREFGRFLETALRNAARVSRDGALHYVFMDWRHIADLIAAGKRADMTPINLCVWVKTNGGMGSFYRSQHELVAVFRNGTAPHANNVELGRHGRNRSNVWQYPGLNSFQPGRLEELGMHPTVKPVALVADAILDCSRRGEVVLDSFAGSGTILLTAERTGRCARALDPRYVDTAVRRWETATGGTAILDGTGDSFAATAAQRETDDRTLAPAGRADAGASERDA